MASPIVEINGEKVQLCGLCGKPTKGDLHPNADVYHMPCMMEHTKHLREGRDGNVHLHDAEGDAKADPS